MPRVGMEPIRRRQLIEAAIYCIERQGIADVTIAQIAQQAGLSSGIISHYFGGKMGLLKETMLELMRNLNQNIADKMATEPQPVSAKRALEIILSCNFDETTNRSAMKVWLSFWAMSMHQPELHRLQKINDNRLYSNLLHHFKQLLPVEKADNAARGLAALIDGLWLHGGLRTTRFDAEQAHQITLQFLNSVLAENSH